MGNPTARPTLGLAVVWARVQGLPSWLGFDVRVYCTMRRADRVSA
jgi:hypothetical protein